MSAVELSFVIPCYRSEQTIERVVTDLSDRMVQAGRTYEIILVNDYSPDNLWSVVDRLAAERPEVKALSLSRNFGQHSALMAGYSMVQGDMVVSLDDDGQSPIELLDAMLAKISEGYDVVYAGYVESTKKSLFRHFGTWMAKKLNEFMLEQPKELVTSSFFVARRFIIDEISQYKNAYPYIGGLVLRTTKNITHLPVAQKERLEGRSGYSFKKLLSLWLNGFTAFSVKPLRLATILGTIISAIGFFSILIIIIRKVMEPSIAAGWSSTISIILLIGGVILFELGMIGEYVGRIYLSLNKAPQYVIKETRNISAQQEGKPHG